MGAKRRRLALSCVACRRRKVKCGREMPSCVRCLKGGQGDTCSYVQYEDKSQAGIPTPTDESPQDKRDASPCQSWSEDADQWQRSSAAGNQNAASSSAAKRRAPPQTLDQLQARLAELEKLVKGAGSSVALGEKSSSGMSQALAGPGPRPHTDAPRNFERSLLRGRSFKTQFYGPSRATSLLLQFEELSAFTKDILKCKPVFLKSKDRLRGDRKAIPFASGIDQELGLGLQQLISMVPPRERTDGFVAQFFETFETTYRVLHIPTFTREYEQFWSDSDGARPWFVVLLLLVCASVNWAVAGDTDAFVGRSSVARAKAMGWIKAAEAWLAAQSDKHTPLEFFQTQVLLVIAKRSVCYKVKRNWTVTGTLLRRVMAAGFHREPTILAEKISVFEQEMRRRLWYTVVELEAQASCTRGLRAAIGPDDWDCVQPLNIHDEDFNETTQVMPSALPLTTFTRTSFLVSASSHVALRLEMLNAINSLSSDMTLAAVMKYDGLTRSALDALPRPFSTGATKTPTCFAHVSSKLLLYEFLLLLHQPFATSSLAESCHFYSRCARRDSALTILRIYTSPKWSLTERLIQTNCQDACLRACLATCHDIVVASDRPGACATDITHDRGMSVDYLRDSVELYATRVKRLGEGFHSYWIISSALALVESRVNPDEPAEKFIEGAAERVMKLQDELKAVQLPGCEGDATADNSRPDTRLQGSQHPNEAALVAGTANGTNGTTPAGVAGGGEPDGETGAGTADASGASLAIGGPTFAVDGLASFDAFGQTVFDFDNFDIWDIDLGGGGGDQFI